MGRSGSRVGGVARHVVDMARAGLPGFNLVVLAPEGKLTSRLEELGVTVIKAEFGPDYGFKTSFVSLQKAIEQLRPDIVPQPPGVCRRCRNRCGECSAYP